jgi:hypothetical protein
MAEGGEDSRAVGTAGAVLIAIGLVALVVAALWNARERAFDATALVSTTATGISFRTELIRTKTSHERWIVVEVAREIDGALASEHWLFPSHSKKIESRLTEFDVGSEVTGLLSRDPVFVRWNDDPFRILWEFNVGEVPLIPLALVREIELENRQASPAIGLAALAVGLSLLLLARWTASRD